MSHSFEISLERPASELITKLKEAADQSGWFFEGDVRSGEFSGDGVKGKYECEGNALRITLLDKPFIAPWSLVESKLREKIS